MGGSTAMPDPRRTRCHHGADAGRGHPQQPSPQDGRGPARRRHPRGAGAVAPHARRGGSVRARHGAPLRTAPQHRPHRRRRARPPAGATLRPSRTGRRAVGRQPAAAVGVVLDRDPPDPGVLGAGVLPDVGPRLRAGARAGPPGRAQPRRGLFTPSWRATRRPSGPRASSSPRAGATRTTTRSRQPTRPSQRQTPTSTTNRKRPNRSSNRPSSEPRSTVPAGSATAGREGEGEPNSVGRRRRRPRRRCAAGGGAVAASPHAPRCGAAVAPRAGRGR